MIFLTGITGFVGGALAAHLVREGREISALVRAKDEPHARARIEASLARFGVATDRVRAIPGDLRDVGSLAGVTHVVHAAACTSFAASTTAWQTNVEGTRALAERCGDVRRFLHVSTAYVVGDAPPALVREEDAPRPEHGHINGYTRSKAAAELMLGEMGFGDRLVIARPSIVVGHTALGVGPSASLFWYYRAMRALGAGPFDLDDRRDIVPVDWVATALAQLLCRDALAHRVYHLSAALCGSTLREIFGSIPWKKVAARAMDAGALAGGARERRRLETALRLCAQFGELGVQGFANDRLLAEGVEAPPPFASYWARCLADPGTIYQQMLGDV